MQGYTSSQAEQARSATLDTPASQYTSSNECWC